MTDFQVPTEANHELPAEIHGDGNSDGATDRVVHDHDGDGRYERYDQGTSYDGLIDLVRRDLGHDGWYDGTVDRLSYDLDGDGHFDLVKDGDTVENSFRY